MGRWPVSRRLSRAAPHGMQGRSETQDHRHAAHQSGEARLVIGLRRKLFLSTSDITVNIFGNRCPMQPSKYRRKQCRD